VHFNFAMKYAQMNRVDEIWTSLFLRGVVLKSVYTLQPVVQPLYSRLYNRLYNGL